MCSMEILCPKKLKLMRCADDDDECVSMCVCSMFMKLEWICCVWLTFSERVHQDYLNKLNRFFSIVILMCQPFIAVGFGRFSDPHSKVMQRNVKRIGERKNEIGIQNHS